MQRWLSRIRGVVGMSLIWATAWAGVGAVIGVFKWFVTGNPALQPVMIDSVVTFVAIGFVFGFMFFVILATAGRRRRFDETSIPRFAALGGVVGLLLFFVLGRYGSHSSVVDDIFNGSVYALLGAGSAAASLVLARRSNPVPGSGQGVNRLESESLQEDTRG